MLDWLFQLMFCHGFQKEKKVNEDCTKPVMIAESAVAELTYTWNNSQ